MSLPRASPSPSERALLPGVHFVDAHAFGRVARTDPAALVVELAPAGPEWRGRLSELIDASFERALARWPGAYVPSDRRPDAWIAAAAAADARGVVLAVGSLRALAGGDGALCPNDSFALREWARAARARQLSLFVAREDEGLAAYAAPVSLRSVLEDPRLAIAEAPLMHEASGETPHAKHAPLFPDLDESTCRGIAHELGTARGPHSLAQIEQIFVSRYVRLAEGERRGLCDAMARRARSVWAETFARNYTEGFAAFRPNGKRPAMVLDAPQIAARLARLHGARATELLVVDALRYDLGLRVHERLRSTLRASAVCVEQMVLWAALPTTTRVQMSLMARGPEGLALASADNDDGEAFVCRGRAVHTVRRVKVGTRDIGKLDVVEARLRELGPPPAERLDSLADDAADAIEQYARTLAPRTLLFVFGDHGFSLDATRDGTCPARQGGASPEEALVPAFAWLIGGVH